MLGEEEEENGSNLFANVNTIVWQVPTSWSPSWNQVPKLVFFFILSHLGYYPPITWFLIDLRSRQHFICSKLDCANY